MLNEFNALWINFLVQLVTLYNSIEVGEKLFVLSKWSIRKKIGVYMYVLEIAFIHWDK